MATAEQAKIQVETGQVLTPYAVMTNSDNTVFTAGTVWSGKAGFIPSVLPNGIETGDRVMSANAANDSIDIATFTAFLAGAQETYVGSGTTPVAITRAGTPTVAQIHSYTMASDGSIAVVEGTVSADQTFSEVRNAAGGPPLIPVTSIEIGQVRVTTSTPAPIAASEILQVVGTHTERWDYPGWKENNIGEGKTTETTGKLRAHIVFDSAIPLNHTGPTARRAYIQYYTPQFSDVSRSTDFVPAEKTHSVTSTQIYGGTVGSTSESLGQGSFTAMLNDGITDTFLNQKNQIVTVKFFSDRNKTPFVLTQGKLGIGRTFPVADQIQAACTISSEDSSAEFAS